MLSAARALRLNAHSAPPLPRVEALAPIWDKLQVTPRRGEVIMIPGRSGSQKSGFALFWTASMGLPTLYFSADMTANEATTRLAAMKLGETKDSIDRRIAAGGEAQYVEALRDSNISFAFGQPVTWGSITANLEAWVELYNDYPAVIVIDNLMDMEGGESDYAMQTQNMQDLTGLARDTGSTVIILHHASEANMVDPGLPPARSHIKNKLSEKPQLILSVALATKLGVELRVACVKQRSGPQSEDASEYVRLRAMPEMTRFEAGPDEWYSSSLGHLY